jgi:hypothetical protein
MDYAGGPTFTATWGRFGSEGRQTEYPVAAWDSYFRQKTSKGYSDVTDGSHATAKTSTSNVAVPLSMHQPVKVKSAFGISPGDIMLHAYAGEVFKPEQFVQDKAQYGGFWLTVLADPSVPEFWLDSEDFEDIAAVRVAFNNPLVVKGADFQEPISRSKAVKVFEESGVDGIEEYFQNHSNFEVGSLKGNLIDVHEELNTSVWFDFFFPLISRQFDSCICKEFDTPNLCIFKPDSRTKIVGWLKKDGKVIHDPEDFTAGNMASLNPEPKVEPKTGPKLRSEPKQLSLFESLHTKISPRFFMG